MNGTAIETYTGLMFDFVRPLPDQVCIEDVAHALANTCRFGGHIQRFYSVAQHALLVRDLVIEAGYPGLSYAALHHDSAEAYIGDAPTPLKVALGASVNDAFARANQAAEWAVGQHFGIPPALFSDPAVKAADEMALRLEAATLKVQDGRTFAEAIGREPVAPDYGRVHWQHPEQVELNFLAAHQVELSKLTEAVG